ncbi:CPBP family intramembrane glutamic endopeptidase [Halioxenophilus sp. WMMB6]|uniref:CPBP family intramembrane glutamic endopeptidase n=1 Tax=Halioxenophilus sp. WMMB6 TaxID=3073815 RepID=UPI00295EAED7|nr:CPBP family intramembrane glutamic endopeptidase [Halioxenophilus sp. WMMB6]
MNRRWQAFNVWRVIEALDNAPDSYTMARAEATRRLFITLACVAVSLLLIHYLKFTTTFYAALEQLSLWAGEAPRYYRQQLYHTHYLELINYAWWTFWHVVGYVLLPWAVLRWLLKLPVASMGVKLNETREHWLGYLMLLSPILLFIYLVSFRSDFLQHYPFYRLAARSLTDFLLWELLYLTQFACLEFFFRGFMLNALRPAVGANAIWIMCVPYLMIHFPKLWLEATGAIFFGFFLGILALRSRSIWGGFLVHAGVAVGMDVASLVTQGKFPQTWWF